jgi:mono/diheme cytochrome c family protein
VLDGQEERETNVRVFTMTVMLAALAGPALADDYKSLPDGPGRDVMVRVCSQCHSPEVAAQQSLDAPGWKALVDQMANNGAQALG